MTFFSSGPVVGEIQTGATGLSVLSLPAGYAQPRTVATTAPVIGEIPSRKYRIVRPIPVQVKVDGYGDVIASLPPDVGISMSGDTQSQAIDALAAQVALLFARYKKAPDLGPWAVRQLRALEKHIAEKKSRAGDWATRSGSPRATTPSYPSPTGSGASPATTSDHHHCPRSCGAGKGNRTRLE